MKKTSLFILLLAMANISLAQNFVKIPHQLTIKQIDSLKLERGIIYYVSDKYINRIIAIHYAGKELATGDKIKQGSKVDLILGDGLADKVCVPNLIGLTVQEAEKLLKQLKLQIGTITKQSSNDEIVVKQFPLPTSKQMNEMKINERNMLKEGEKITIWTK